MEEIKLQNLSKQFDGFTAVDDVSLSIKSGELFSFLGPSGCGKTTLLRMIAGFEIPNNGRILIGNTDITDIPPYKRQVNTIFQNYSLFPHMTLFENVAFGLKIRKTPKPEMNDRVKDMLKLVKMDDQANKYPDQISGGQKQRIAIARALINNPKVLLLDEPLAALDLKLRQHMLIELDLIHDEVGITFVYVTHDQGEAMSLSDRIAVMNAGKIEQIDTPASIYETPRSSFVAAFIGDTNFFLGTVAAEDGSDYCRLEVPDFEPVVCYNDKRIRTGSPVHLSMRPERIRVSHARPENPEGRVNLFRGKVEDCVYQGSHTRYWVRVHDYRISVFQPHSRFLLDEKPIRWGEDVWLWWHADDGYMLEQYREADENLLLQPPESIGDSDAVSKTGDGGADGETGS